MPLIRFPTVKGLVFTVDLSKLASRELPEGSTQTLEEYRRTVEAPLHGQYAEPVLIDWGDGDTEILTSETWPEHTYAAAGVYTVTLRSATGKLPFIRLNYSNSEAEITSPTKNFTWAIVSLDHFGGTCSTGTFKIVGCYACKNLTYLDTRYICQPHITNLTYGLYGCESLDQPFESFGFEFVPATIATFLFRGCKKMYGGMKPGSFDHFAANIQLSSFFYQCVKMDYITAGMFDFATQAPYVNAMFRGCTSLKSIPEGLFDKCVSIANVSSCFQGCANIEGEPYKFWEQSYASNITNSGSCYSGCAKLDLTQIPEAYGGTMTVS